MQRWLSLALVFAAPAMILAALSFDIENTALATTPTPSAPPGYAIQRVSPSSQTVSTSQATFTVDVAAEDAANLGAYEVLLTFDSAAMSLSGVVNSEFLGSTGRSVFCTPAVVQTLPGTLRKLQFGCGTIGAPPPFGPNGDGTLATVTFAPLTAGVSELLLDPALSDPLGDPINTVAYGGQVDIQPGPTATFTSTPTPTATNTPCPGACPTPTPVQCAPTVVSIDPPIAAGHPFVAVDVGVRVQNVCRLGAFEFAVAFDPALLSHVTTLPGGFLGSTGRTVQCAPNAAGVGEARYSCISLGDVPPDGPSGAGLLATLRFLPLMTGTAPVTFTSISLVEPDASPVVASSAGGAIEVTACASCPTATPTSTVTVTPTFTPTPTFTLTPSPTPCPGACPTPTFTSTPVTPTVVSGSSAVVRVQPSTQQVGVGGLITTDVMIENTANLGGFSVILSWNPARASLHSTVEGAFLGSSGRGTFCAPITSGMPAGSMRYVCGSLGATLQGASGSGKLATIRLNALSAGSTPLDLSAVELVAPSAAALPLAAAMDASADIIPCAPACPSPTPATSPTPAPSPVGAAQVSVAPPGGTIGIGDAFSVDLNVANIANLAAFDIMFEYNTGPAVFLEFEGWQPGPFLGSTARAVFCQPPSVTNFTVRVACASFGTSPPGPAGTGTLARLDFRAIAGGITHAFGVQGAGLADPFANAIPAQWAPAATVSALPPTPTPTPPAGLVGASGSSPAQPDATGVALPSAPVAGAIATSLLIVAGVTFTRQHRRAFMSTVAVAALVLVARSQEGDAQIGARLIANPPSANLWASSAPIDIDIELAGVPADEPYVGYTLALRYDPALLHVVASPGPHLTGTGTAQCFETTSAYFERWSTCTLDASASITGDGVIARLQVSAAPGAAQALAASAPNGGIAAIDIDAAMSRVLKPGGGSVPISFTVDPLLAVRELEGDIAPSCAVDATDRQIVLAGYGSRLGWPSYSAAHDVEPPGGDGDIDIHDAQVVFGRAGSSCAAPSPAQPPPAPIVPLQLLDLDHDSVLDGDDNCPAAANSAQADIDIDLLGDTCELLLATDPSLPDSDGDGCSDGREALVLQFTPNRGGDRNPADAWDFFDVTGDRSIDLADSLAVLAYFGDPGISPAGNGRDRSTPDVLKPWRTAEGNDGVDLRDALASLQSFGHVCN